MSRFWLEVEVDDRLVPNVREFADTVARNLWPASASSSPFLDVSVVRQERAAGLPLAIVRRESTDLDDTYSVTLDGHDLLGLIVTDTGIQVIAWDDDDEGTALTLRNIER